MAAFPTVSLRQVRFLGFGFAVVAGPDVARPDNNVLQRLEDFDFWAMQERRLIARCGVIDPENIGHYIGTGGYGGFVNALDMTPEELIRALEREMAEAAEALDFERAARRRDELFEVKAKLEL